MGFNLIFREQEQEAPGNIPENIPKDIPVDFPEVIPEDVPEDIPEDIVEDVPEFPGQYNAQLAVGSESVPDFHRVPLVLVEKEHAVNRRFSCSMVGRHAHRLLGSLDMATAFGAVTSTHADVQEDSASTREEEHTADTKSFLDTLKRPETLAIGVAGACLLFLILRKMR